MFREYETTDHADLESFSRRVSVLHSYVKFWPTDKVAADDDNDEYLSLA